MGYKNIEFSEGQRGASVVEFLVAAPVLFLMGLGTLQAGLLYHGKTVVNYATFEAARVGATRHASPEAMKKELGLRLAPLYGGNGTMGKATEAMARSSAEVISPVNMDGTVAPATEVKVLNPTIEAFEKWGVPSIEYKSRTAIPNSHLKHQNKNEGQGTAGMTLSDANLLKIQVTHGVELKVPLVNKLILGVLAEFEALQGGDLTKLAYYQAGRFPITSTATVRMQSEAWKESIVLANAPPPVSAPPDPVVTAPPDPVASDPPDPADPDTPLPEDPAQCNANGLPGDLATPASVPLSCPVSVGNNPLGGGGGISDILTGGNPC